MKTLLTILFLFLLMATIGCASNPYWAIPHHDGIEKRTYMKRGWTNNAFCTTYDSNRPVQRSTWANQFYWNPKK